MKHILTIAILLAACACAPKWEVLDADGYTLIVQKGGPALGYTTSPILHDKQMPADMRTVEDQFEDVPQDMRPLKDSDGNIWDFGFGLSWSGVISDARTEHYCR